MPDTVTIDTTAAYQTWIDDVDAARGMSRCLARGFCFRCERHTLVSVWTNGVLFLHCPCLSEVTDGKMP